MSIRSGAAFLLGRAMAKSTKLIVNRPPANKMAKGSAVRVTAPKASGKSGGYNSAKPGKKGC